MENRLDVKNKMSKSLKFIPPFIKFNIIFWEPGMVLGAGDLEVNAKILTFTPGGGWRITVHEYTLMQRPNGTLTEAGPEMKQNKKREELCRIQIWVWCWQLNKL